MTENERPDTPEERPETPEEGTPEAAAEESSAPEAADEQSAEEPAAAAADEPEQPEAEAPDQPEAEAPDQPQAEEAAPPEEPEAEPEAPSTADAPPPRDRAPAGEQAEEVVPGADLEPDLVLDDRPQEDDRYADAAERYPSAADDDEVPPASDDAPAPAEEPQAATPVTLAADARYTATGKRKTSVARVILSPGDGSYTVNGRPLEEFFPRPTLQKAARQPLATAGYDGRMNVVAKLHGGGVSSQAGALRHGIARALAGADPNLRGDLKRRGFLTRDPRVKERKKAGLKKARKRPQFSKR